MNGLVDTANQQALVLGAIADGGTLVEVRSWTEPSERSITIHPIAVNSFARDTSRLEQVRDLAESGVLCAHHVAEVLPAVEAHRRLEQRGLHGRLVLDFIK